MNRRTFLAASAAAAASGGAAWKLSSRAGDEAALAPRPIALPNEGMVRTAFAIGPGVNVIDAAGPWEVFCDSAVDGGAMHFDLYTVAATREQVEGNSGLMITPRYTYADAPQPHLVVIPAHDAGEDTVAWLRHVAARADLLMSVCTGAFVLADTGLLDGKTATTHHGSYADFARMYPKIELVRGMRFVEHDHVATAGGLTSGIDLALRVVERYLGRDGAVKTARYLEYTSRSKLAYAV